MPCILRKGKQRASKPTGLVTCVTGTGEILLAAKSVTWQLCTESTYETPLLSAQKRTSSVCLPPPISHMEPLPK
eukprot:scaffold38209_cov55-Attheya_sp.AAC.1